MIWDYFSGLPKTESFATDTTMKNHQSLAISDSFLGIQTRMLILIANSIYSVLTIININQVFEWKINYFVFGTMCNLTMIIACKYHYCIKFITCTSYVIVFQSNFLNRKQNIIRQRILICHKSDCSSKNNFKSLVILIVLYIFLFIFFNNLVLII